MGLGLRRILNRLLPGTSLRAALREEARERSCREEFLSRAFKALTFNGIGGDYAEFGCCGGTTFALAHRACLRHGHRARLWAFDSFRGLPPPRDDEDRHPNCQEGARAMTEDDFHRACRKQGIPRDRYTVVAGFYESTLDRMAPTAAPADICLAYIDCDLCSSARTVLKFLMPRLKHGMIIACDDYYCWSPTHLSGERRAMLEAFDSHPRWRLQPYIQYGWHGASFVVETK